MATLTAQKSLDKPLTRKVNENVPVTRFAAEALEQPTYCGQYEDMLDIVAVQDKRLLVESNKIEFLRSLLPHGQETFGFKNLARRYLEPSMCEIFSYGYEGPIKNDYTKNKAELSNKIRKMKRAYISESHDNYRQPKSDDNDGQYEYDHFEAANRQLLFNYFDSDEIELFKKKLFEKATTSEREIRNQTMYKEFFGSAEALRNKLNEIQTWSAAGQKAPISQKRQDLDPNLTQKGDKLWIFGERPDILDVPVQLKRGVDQGGKDGPLVHPVKLQWEFIEAKLREMGFTSETVAAAAAAYAEERAEAASQSRHNADMDGSLRNSRMGAAAGADLADQTMDCDDENRELTKEEKKSIREKMKKLKLEGRLLPDSAMTTYFGKPAFHTYGNGNVRPASGGLVYGQYLKTHNINPHSGDNKPENLQVYVRALTNPKVVVRGGQRSPKNRKSSLKDNFQAAEKGQMPQMIRVPKPPRQPVLKRPLTAKNLDELKKRTPIMPEGFMVEKHVPIQPPIIRPDPQITHQMRLDRHQQSDQSIIRKQSSRGQVRYQPVDDYRGTSNRSARFLDESEQASSPQRGGLSEHAEITMAENQYNGLQQDSQVQQHQKPSSSDMMKANCGKDPHQHSGMIQLNQTMPFCPRHQVINTVSPGHPDPTHMMVQTQTTELLHLLNPKNYRYLPPQYTHKIRQAGRMTAESETVGGIIGYQ